MNPSPRSRRGFGKPSTVLFLFAVAAFVVLLVFSRSIVRFVHELLMQRVTSAHYEVRFPHGALSPDAMTEFAKKREPLFAALNKKLRDADSNVEIRVVFDPKLPLPLSSDPSQPFYTVAGTTIRSKLTDKGPRLPAAADAEALLYAAWGRPGSAELARWTANWLVGEWRGEEIGMAAASVEQRLGHKNVQVLLVDPGGEIASPDDRTLLGAAWISEVGEFGGASAVRRLYAARMLHPNVADVAKALGTTEPELDRKWQLWIYAYIAGMPAPPSDSGMPMDMPMGNSP